MKKKIVFILVILYFAISIILKLFNSNSYIIVNGIKYKLNGNSIESTDSISSAINNDELSYYNGVSSEKGYINYENGVITLYDSSYNVFQNNYFAYFGCDVDVLSFDSISEYYISDEEINLISNKINNKYDLSNLKYAVRTSYDLDNDGNKETIYSLSNYVSKKDIQVYNYNIDFVEDYFELILIEKNGEYSIVVEKTINDNDTLFYIPSYIFNVDNGNYNIYLRIVDSVDFDYSCSGIYSYDDKDIIESCLNIKEDEIYG